MTPHNTPQPPPQLHTTDLHQSAHWLVCSDLMDRAALGQQKYGVPLMADNGRDHLTDAYQELLDLVAYLRCEMERRKNTPAMTLDGMATVLSFEGYLVYGPEQAMPERTWRRIGEKEGYLTSMSHVEMAELLKVAGYGIMPPPQGVEAPEAIDDDTQACAQYPPLARTPEAWPRVEDRAGLIQDRVPTEEASRPAQTVPYQPEHADMPATPPQMPQIACHPEERCQCGCLHTQHTASPSPWGGAHPCKECACLNYEPSHSSRITAATPRPGPTIIEHCMASEQRQGKTVARQEILEDLLRHKIPYDALWEDWSAEVARLCPGRWEN